MLKFSKHASLSLLGPIFRFLQSGAMRSWATHRFNNTIMYYGLFGGGSTPLQCCMRWWWCAPRVTPWAYDGRCWLEQVKLITFIKKVVRYTAISASPQSLLLVLISGTNFLVPLLLLLVFRTINVRPSSCCGGCWGGGPQEVKVRRPTRMAKGWDQTRAWVVH